MRSVSPSAPPNHLTLALLGPPVFLFYLLPFLHSAWTPSLVEPVLSASSRRVGSVGGTLYTPDQARLLSPIISLDFPIPPVYYYRDVSCTYREREGSNCTYSWIFPISVSPPLFLFLSPSSHPHSHPGPYLLRSTSLHARVRGAVPSFFPFIFLILPRNRF